MNPQPSAVPRLASTSRGERGAVAAITVAFLAVCATWAVLSPIYAVPDEHAHLNSAIRLTEGVDWPAPGEARMAPAVINARDEAAVPAAERSTFAELAAQGGPSGVDQMSQHPPLYYGLAAGVLRAVDYENMRADRTLLLLRLIGLVIAAPLPLLVWNATRRLTGSPRAGVVAAAVLLMIPQLAQVLGGVSNDGLTILTCSVVVWLAVRWMTGDHRRRVLAALGTSLGLALLTKGTALPFIIFTGLVLVLWPRGLPLVRRCSTAVLTLGLAFVVGGWWWLRNLLVYGEAQPDGLAPIHRTKPWEPGTGPDFIQYMDLFWARFTTRFWGEFGLLAHPLPSFVTDLLSVTALVVALSYAYGRHPRRAEVLVLSVLPVALMAMLVTAMWQLYVRTQLTAGMQGRYLYVAIVALLAISAIAWMRAVSPVHHRRAGVVVVLVAASMAVLGPFRQYIGSYENAFYRVTADGLRAMLAATPAGTVGFVLVVAVTAMAGSVAVVSTLRYLVVHDSRRIATGGATAMAD